MLAPDVVQLHGEGIPRAAQVLVVHHDGQRETALAPAGDERCQALEDRERHAGHDHRRVDVRATRDPLVTGGAAVEGEADELLSERRAHLLRERGDLLLGARAGSRHERL